MELSEISTQGWSKEKLIETMLASLDALTIEQFKVHSVNAIINQISINTGRISSLEELKEKDISVIRAIAEELLRLLRIQLQFNLNVMRKRISQTSNKKGDDKE